ncbi:hypothetical protein E2C00_32765 [Streptomyces sp. WAC05374]|uniref:hypothetical protein n=1 Tax=Streptomyces sp. WAC05374 TaxID=2487420 RepID=UPI000F877869|nr:hypothetical protein [Streptomyces sp. WAC05374]RST19037.1 hypothetical protein EF905_02660 [Streptomyces sp. WAC05374]TDF36995.1 hypothetical protein E2B92_30415 [Streptomyces sp. WAC05374]TDF46490.1 hypothetical protein E2C02_32060 [Streptomyces sp. WAC05374]TDF47591.1 hypothetical protein E2C00_32765 [Streptomyces sp. WAC05374]
MNKLRQRCRAAIRRAPAGPGRSGHRAVPRPHPAGHGRRGARPVMGLRRGHPGTLRGPAVTLFLAVLATILHSVPAHAEPSPVPTTAMTRCAHGFDPDASAALHLPGGRGTTFPSDARGLRPGDVLRIVPRMNDEVSTTGFWWQPADGSNWVTPAGADPRRAAPAGYPAPGLNAHSLIGRITGAQPFEVLSRSGCRQIGISGKLDLRINDPQDWDNFGAWNVDIQLYRNPLQDGGFEAQGTSSVSQPWNVEGPDAKVISTSAHGANSGSKSAVLSSPGTRVWNALSQPIPVRPHTNYVITGFFRTSSNVNTAFFGVRLPGVQLPVESHFGPAPGWCPSTTPTCYGQITVPFNSGNNTTVTAFAGFWGVGTPAHMSIDDIKVLSS